MAKPFFPIIKQQAGIGVAFLTVSLFSMLISGGASGCAPATKPVKKPAIMNLKPFPREPEPCAVHPRFASFRIKTLAVLPLEDSDKTMREDWVTPSKTKMPRYKYPIQKDGEYLAGVLENELVNSFKYTLVERVKIDKIIGEMALAQTGVINPEKAKMIGKLIGADAIITGRVDRCYSSLVRKTQKGGAWLATYVATVSFTIRMVDVEGGTIILNCRKSGNSRNFLDKEYSFNSHEEARTHFAGMKAALHGIHIEERIDYVARKLMIETVEEFPPPADF
jgi:curli biogenesis system outer membrane secretion channel CsgG